MSATILSLGRFERSKTHARDLVCLFPEHRTYCDLFGGDISILMAKPSCPVDVYNDQDADLVNLFRVIRDKRLFAQLREALDLTLYAREEMALSLESCSDRVEKARRFIVRHWQGRNDQWSYSVHQSNRGRASAVARWQAVLRHLDGLHKRVCGVQIEKGRWEVVAERYDSENTLFFVDTGHAQLHTDQDDEIALEGVPTRADQQRIEQWERILFSMASLNGMAIVRTHDRTLDDVLHKAKWGRPAPDLAHGAMLWFSPKALHARFRQTNNAAQRPLF